MAWILNKQTKVITECSNKDVIKVCKNDLLNYAVTSTYEEAKNVIDKEVIQEKENRPSLSKMKVDELRTLAEEMGIDHAGLNAEELRKVIKDEQSA